MGGPAKPVVFTEVSIACEFLVDRGITLNEAGTDNEACRRLIAHAQDDA
jgi:hypothetical protein